MADDDPNLLPLVTGNGRTLATADITALIGLINGMLGSMEARIIERLAENSRGAETRWEAHDRASERTIAAIRAGSLTPFPCSRRKSAVRTTFSAGTLPPL